MILPGNVLIYCPSLPLDSSLSEGDRVCLVLTHSLCLSQHHTSDAGAKNTDFRQPGFKPQLPLLDVDSLG